MRVLLIIWVAFLLAMTVYRCVPSCGRDFATDKNLAIHASHCQKKSAHDARETVRLAARFAEKKTKKELRKKQRRCAEVTQAPSPSGSGDVTGEVAENTPVRAVISSYLLRFTRGAYFLVSAHPRAIAAGPQP